MGSECHCIKDYKENECRLGEGMYSFKKTVCKTKLIFLIKIQHLPRTKSEEIYYGKDSDYEKDVKNKIDRTSSLVRNGVSEYTNGNVEVILPCAGNNF